MQKKLPAHTLVLGGGASGKSAFAENLLINSGLEPVYIATARIWDDEIKLRVKVHQDRRGPEWSTLHATLDPGAALAGLRAGQAALIDCATMWLTNHVIDKTDLAAAQATLLEGLATAPVPVVIVTNEIGQGIVPMEAETRAFRESQGRLNIALAAQADCAVQVVAGLPNVLKGALS
ncbi:MAG: bifunctional adenosylcobinamide kinase/adenosylcobinamide-phosphate guanylyltransferase [Pseudomonadota bacterium]